ncbi:LysR family transcriptional regulator [Leekyejoonella antrihumi]|uniref:LysR family transcriptional regulator n=1 Tax=Leekyejoonella antrihumi TaxID=1660198 RepID=A0A563E4X0_9MICO|nr:LysR family transcriptional regulator [Leekyejoonella antrihumi]TWP37598.1 LysR family transcriptional regulator [Leekyejoonella antrihumi]
MREHLRWFVVLAEEENVSAAADRLHMSQPTLSRQLARLEKHLETRLFDRHGRRLALNAAGRVFAGYAGRADAELAAGEQEVRDLTTGGPRVVRLGFLHSFGTWLVPDLIEATHDQDPSLRFELVQGSSEAVTEHVVTGAVELGIVSPKPTTARVAWRRLLRQSVVLAVPAHHRLSGRRSVRPSELADEAFVTMQAGFGMRQILDELAAASGITPHIAAECQELSTVAGLVAARIGVALLPGEVHQHHPPGMVTLPLAGVDSGRDVGLIWARGRTLSTPAISVRDLARQMS